MSAHTTKTDFCELSRRFVAETSDFLTENWDVERVWWPLRAGGGGAGAGHPESAADAATPEWASAADLTAVPAAPAGQSPAAAPTPVTAEVRGCNVPQLFVIVPADTVVGTSVLCTAVNAAQRNARDADEHDPDWPIWVPEVFAALRRPPAAAERVTVAT